MFGTADELETNDLNIHSYASVGDCSGVREELENGVPVDARDYQAFTPLAHAARGSDAGEEIIRLLVDSGADVNAVVDNSSECPLGLAACSGDLRKAQILFDAGADINLVLPKGYTVLIKVMYALHDDEMLIPVAAFLVQNGAEINCETEYGESPLNVASRLGRFDAVKLLLDAGGDPTPLGWTELMKAIAWGSCDDVKAQLCGKGELEHRDRCDRTPWLLAAFVGELEKAKLVFSAGASLDDRSRRGDTALTYCAARGHADLLQWLIEIGADIEVADDARNTALMLASQEGQTTCVELLLKASADPSRKNEYDKNAMSLASNEPIMRLLEKAGEDIGDINKKAKRTLTGLHDGESLKVSKAEYGAGKRPRFGKSNPELMDIPFWKEMARAGIAAYQGKAQFGDENDMSEPAWCFSRFGMSFTELPDGRIVQIGGEHEDFYDPDFCIYNDVIVHERSGKFQIMGYPKDVFPPTDFHSATHIDGFIYIVGGLGYHGSRRFGVTPIYRLNCRTWKIEAVESSGDNPGWIFEHKARLDEPGSLVVSGGKTGTEIGGEEQHAENDDEFHLDLAKMIWTRVKAK